MTMALGLRLASAAVLAIGFAGCGGGGDSAGTDAGALGASAKTLAATSSPTADGGSVASTIVKLHRYQIDPTKVFVAGISSGGFAAVQMHVAHSSTFKGAAVSDLSSEYQRYGANVHFDNAYSAEHGWESPDGELACGTLGSPYMVRCSANGAVYDSVETWLTMFLGPLKPRNNGKLSGTLSSFDQTEFGASQNLSMSSTGSVFVPKACAQGSRCGFVLALHGCLQEASLIGNRWVTEAGINEWADTNKLVVVYPDTIASSAPGPTNPNACFDWWGYSNQYDPNYALRSGLQMSVLYAMVQRVTGRP